MDTFSEQGMNKLQESGDAAPSYGSLSQAQTRHCVEVCAATSVEFIQEHFASFWSEWIASVEKREENARSNKEQLALSEIIKRLRSTGPSVERGLIDFCRQNFDDFTAQQLKTPTGQERFSAHAGLSLVENAELEETIAITSICHRADSQFAETLWALHQRLALLNDGKKLDERSNPASPIQFCEAFRKSIAEYKLETRVKVIGYKHFESSFVKLLGGLYQELNNRLAEAGVLPNLRFTAGPAQGEGRPAAGPESGSSLASEEAQPPQRRATDREPEPRRRATDQAPQASEKGPEEYQQGLVSAIRLLQTHLGGALTSMPAGSGFGAAAPSSGAGQAPPVVQDGATGAVSAQVMGVVQQAQAQQVAQVQSFMNAPMGQVQPLAVNSVSSELADALAKTDSDADDMHTIELVGLLFEYILSEDQLPDSVKALLSYLHTPVLKLAFIDTEFFENVDHPARLLLNQMAEAGARWVGNDDTDQYDMYEKIKTVVFNVLKNFGNDAKVFAEALIEFSGYTRNISRRQDLMEKRALEKARGEEKLREAKILVNDEVSKLIDGKDLPSPVLLLMLLPWSDYLSFVILRYGTESENFTNALRVARDLIWSVEPKLLETDKVKQLEIQDGLMKTVQSGFETIGYEQDKARKLIDAIRSLQKLALKSQKAEPAPKPMRDKLESMAAEKAGRIEPAQGVATEEESQLVEKLKLIEFGTWLEDDDGKRMKVAWYNHKTNHYMLVDQQGKKVSMTSALQMARAMIAGKLRVIAGSAKPFFERALENIYHSLNAKASGELLNQE
ncbi:DUF1631 domain-containing protein [Gilvimarinus agarilyticus]|uniref:DUF1631 family protein n=1 Tax=Gilvimarinus sp. 2_MG-2023 TaxID=3062666 RepID=UPI001C0886B0|nr:DUF1631 family protein [Gilvimarinus sp. 2_MG-2023]MBU2885351.1 DUF1631 domain-containing protein [Gilvimarinus agarilyticus]MDO6570250.1 DUF1631 family protein [Gilvimarinus sp. 2_MG-2023]